MAVMGLLSDGSEYDEDEKDFMLAMDRYKRARGRPFPTWCEVLAVLKSRGWRRVAEAAELPQPPRLVGW